MYQNTLREEPGIDPELAIELTHVEYACRYDSSFDHVEAWQLLRQL